MQSAVGMRQVAVVVLLLLGASIGGTGLLALVSRATGWTIRTRASAGTPGLEVPTDLDFALAFSATGAVLLGLSWLLGRRR